MQINDYIFLPISRSRKRIFKLNEILYFKADNVYTNIVLFNKGSFFVSIPLHQFEKMLCSSDGRFIKTSRNYIINIGFIVEVSTGMKPDALLSNNERVAISKNQIKTILERISNSQVQTDISKDKSHTYQEQRR